MRRKWKSKIKRNKRIGVKKKSTPSVKKRWVPRKKTFSPYPYLITISYHKRNVFFTVADIKGHTKGWLSTGKMGFKNKDKTTYMALVRVTELFWKKMWSLGIRNVILKFKNISKRKARSAIRKGMRKTRRRYRLRYLGILVQIQTAFNGCRKKKKRRK